MIRALGFHVGGVSIGARERAPEARLPPVNTRRAHSEEASAGCTRWSRCSWLQPRCALGPLVCQTWKKNTLLMTSTRSIHALMTLIAADNAYPATTVTLQRIFVTVIHNCFCFCDKYTIGKNNEILLHRRRCNGARRSLSSNLLPPVTLRLRSEPYV